MLCLRPRFFLFRLDHFFFSALALQQVASWQPQQVNIMWQVHMRLPAVYSAKSNCWLWKCVLEGAMQLLVGSDCDRMSSVAIFITLFSKKAQAVMPLLCCLCAARECCTHCMLSIVMPSVNTMVASPVILQLCSPCALQKLFTGNCCYLAHNIGCHASCLVAARLYGFKRCAGAN